jgi:hypothetical protein
MYYIWKITKYWGTNYYFVRDTKDGSIEEYTYEQLDFYRNQGVKIKGLVDDENSYICDGRGERINKINLLAKLILVYGSQFEFKLDNEGYIAIAGIKKYTSVLEIPRGVEKFDSYWDGDACYCTFGNSIVESVILPDSIVQVGFCRFSALKYVNKIPYGVKDMDRCFEGCKSLVEAPDIPSSVRDMSLCFWCCDSLVKAPEIPSGVTDMYGCFEQCISLRDKPKIPSSVRIWYDDIFR